MQLFKTDVKNTASFSTLVLSSLVCGSQPQGYKTADPSLTITSALQPREKVRAKDEDPQHPVTFKEVLRDQ